MSKQRLALVVDDHQTNRLLASALLKRLGWDVQEAESGTLALDCASRQSFQLILLDISMPGLSGEETCSRLRQVLPLPAPRIIAYTAHAFPEDRERLLGAGFDEVLVKPVNRMALETLIADL